MILYGRKLFFVLFDGRDRKIVEEKGRGGKVDVSGCGALDAIDWLQSDDVEGELIESRRCWLIAGCWTRESKAEGQVRKATKRPGGVSLEIRDRPVQAGGRIQANSS